MKLFPEATDIYAPIEPPIMPVLYDEDYKITLTNLNFALDNNELSERVFNLTTHMLSRNTFHYTNFTLRRRII
jgi:hypothetical protein